MPLQRIHQVFGLDRNAVLELLQYNLCKHINKSTLIKELYQNDLFDTSDIRTFIQTFNFKRLVNGEYRIPSSILQEQTERKKVERLKRI